MPDKVLQYVFMLAKAGQTAGKNCKKNLEETH